MVYLVPRTTMGVWLCILLQLIAVARSHITDYEQPDPFMDPDELESLFQVMEALTNEIDWRKHYPHPCTGTPWPGIRCEEQDDGLSHVVRIDFGSLPNSTCKHNATMSPALLKLPFLRSLFLLNCFQSSNTSILTGISKLAPTLQTLSLRGNPALVGTIPSELGRLVKLEVLSLSQNGFSGSIPKELGAFPRIQNLDLGYNALTGTIPSELGDLKTLTILDLNGNHLTGNIPVALGALPSLQKLDLSSNRLQGRIPPQLGTLPSLKFLALSDNLLTGGIPSSFAGLTNLEYLILHNNPMQSSLPDFWSNLVNLSELSLSNSGYFGTMPESLGSLVDLSELSLEKNSLNGSIPGGLASLENLYHLNLSDNMLTGPVPFSREMLYRMGENLDLRGNPGLCLRVAVPRNVSTKNLSSCSALGLSSSSASSSWRTSAFSVFVFFLVAAVAVE